MNVNGYWLVPIENYRWNNSYNTIYFSCAWTAGIYNCFWSGYVLFNALGNTLTFSTPIFSQSLSVQSYWDGTTMYIRVNMTAGAAVNSGTYLYYKTIG